MSVTLKASAGYLMRHPWQLFLAILGITVGVAVIVAVDLANQSSRAAFIQSMRAVNGDATHQIVAGPGGIDEEIYTNLRVSSGVRSIAPIVSGTVRVANRRMQVLGIDVFAEREFRTFTTPVPAAGVNRQGDAQNGEELVRQFLSSQDIALLPATVADALGLEPGQSFELTANGKSHTARFGGRTQIPGNAALENLIIADISAAQQWLGMAGKLTRIDVKVTADDENAAREIAALLPPGIELLSAAGRTETTVGMSDAFMTNLFAMSLLALLVGVFLIYNSVAFAVLQRRDLIGVLRALGVTRVQVFRLILGEAAVLGLIGAALGVLAGIFLGEKLLVLVSRSISDHYFAVDVTRVVIDCFTVAKGVVAGTGATLVAAAVPALEASSYRPRLALARSVLESRAGKALPKIAIGGLTMSLLSVVLLLASGTNLVAGLIALFMLILGFALCIPLAVGQLSRLLEPFAARVSGTVGRIAIGGVGRNLSRTGVAVVALAIAVSATIGVSIMVESFRDSVSDWLNTTLQSDVYIGVPRGTLEAELAMELVELPGVAAYSTSRRAWLESATGRTQLIAIQMAPGSYAGTQLRDADPKTVWPRFDNDEAVLVSDALAYRWRIEAGDEISLNTARGDHTFAVAAVFQSYDANNGAIMMSRATYDRYFDDPAVDSLGIYLETGLDVTEFVTAVHAASEGRQAVITSGNARIRDISLQIFDRTFVITNVLYWLAVVVAIIGIFGAMLAMQLERAREFGVLRAVGMTPLQTGAIVTVQTGFIGLMSGLAAVPIGLAMAYVLIAVINRRAFGWDIDFSVAPQVLASAVLLAVGAGLLAGVYPAWCAASTRPALTMRQE